jgi:hypothetical protein
MDKETFMAKMLYAAMTNPDSKDEVMKQECDSHPEWHEEHLKMLEANTMPGLESSPGRRRLATNGAFKDTKGHDGDFFETAEDGKNDNEERIKNIEDRMAGLEVSSQAMIKVMEKFDQSLSNNIMMVKKRDLSMKSFYDKIRELRRKIMTNQDYGDKVGKWIASGPVVAVECMFFGDMKAVGDKIRTLTSKDEMTVITGSTPMRQLIEEIP